MKRKGLMLCVGVVVLVLCYVAASGDEAKGGKVYGFKDFPAPAKEKVEGEQFFGAVYVNDVSPAKDRAGLIKVMMDDGEWIKNVRALARWGRDPVARETIVTCTTYLPPKEAIDIESGGFYNISATIATVTVTHRTTTPKKGKPVTFYYVSIELTEPTFRAIP